MNDVMNELIKMCVWVCGCVWACDYVQMIIKK